MADQQELIYVQRLGRPAGVIEEREREGERERERERDSWKLVLAEGVDDDNYEEYRFMNRDIYIFGRCFLKYFLHTLQMNISYRSISLIESEQVLLT